MTPPAGEEERTRKGLPFVFTSLKNIKDGQRRNHLHTILSTVFRRAAQNNPKQQK
jgi:hypothetical protein